MSMEVWDIENKVFTFNDREYLSLTRCYSVTVIGVWNPIYISVFGNKVLWAGLAISPGLTGEQSRGIVLKVFT